MNRQDIIDYINKQFGTQGERLWASFPEYIVFRNDKNKKWFAIIMDIEKSKLSLPGEGKVDIINLKCEPIFIGSLLKGNGYLPAYHMNKQNWITVLLDSSADPQEIRDLIDLSYELIDGKYKRNNNIK